MKIELDEQDIAEIEFLFSPVYEFFESNFDKTLLWFTTPNPMLGNVSPVYLMQLGCIRKVRKFIVNSLE